MSKTDLGLALTELRVQLGIAGIMTDASTMCRHWSKHCHTQSLLTHEEGPNSVK